MKRKKWKWNYYILAFLIFIILMFLIDLKFEGLVAEYFQNQILFDSEKVLFLGVERSKGIFYWPRLKDILTFIAVLGFILLEIVVYVTTKYSQNKERKMTIDELEQRISLLIKGEVPQKVQELKIIDSEISNLMHENDLVKQEISLEMSKKNDLVTYLAHDLKTPLTSIIGYLTILDESEIPEDVRRDYIKKLLKKAYRLEDLTNQFFDITRFNLQQIPLNKSLLDADFFLEQLTEELYPMLRDKNLKFDINLPPNTKLYVDGSLFARVLNNLLKNAIAYSHKDSIIKIKVKVGKYSTQLFLENDGDVISEQELKLIFEKFYRRDQSRSQSAGAGLGLAIAREIIERHQGSIEAESKSGHTTFTITLLNA
ncbi:HAMP domain-containing sensor histidine kinase [Clostridium sp. JS66]|uniref:sensor histidine kinase n=1 Tax=Clostridium sp. JS66 TaxID=3064705 RepID=UPI00298E640D|nr:HAMP domain-containing sensor histidine kinase [Clostridium sp. JS66]WPC41470.1 HAMP domain-containing sensor histidine kinase [Clostridium sp. JS66]